MERGVPSRYDNGLCFLFRTSVLCSRGIHESLNQCWSRHKLEDDCEQHKTCQIWIILPPCSYGNSVCTSDAIDVLRLCTEALRYRPAWGLPSSSSCWSGLLLELALHDDCLLTAKDAIPLLLSAGPVFLFLFFFVTVMGDVSSCTSSSLQQT